MHIKAGLHGNTYCMWTVTVVCVYFDFFESDESLNHLSTSRRKTPGKRGMWVKEREAESHCYDRLKIDQISAMIFFIFFPELPLCLFPASISAQSWICAHQWVESNTCKILFEVLPLCRLVDIWILFPLPSCWNCIIRHITLLLLSF